MNMVPSSSSIIGSLQDKAFLDIIGSSEFFCCTIVNNNSKLVEYCNYHLLESQTNNFRLQLFTDCTKYCVKIETITFNYIINFTVNISIISSYNNFLFLFYYTKNYNQYKFACFPILKKKQYNNINKTHVTINNTKIRVYSPEQKSTVLGAQ